MRKLYLSLMLFFPLVVSAHDFTTLCNAGPADCLTTWPDTATVARQEPGYAAQPMAATGHAVVDTTTQTVKEPGQWVSLVTFSPKIGFNAIGWSLQFYGFKQRDSRRWAIPLHWSYERTGVFLEPFARQYYQANLQYLSLGISPFYRLNDYFFLNLGLFGHFGQEELRRFWFSPERSTFYGVSASQGVYFMSRSRFGITIGLSVYEKSMGSRVYKTDQGVKLEVGVKF